MTFCIDNEGMIRVPASPVITSKVVKECKDYLNMMADELAKAGSASLTDELEPFFA